MGRDERTFPERGRGSYVKFRRREEGETKKTEEHSEEG